MCFCGNINSPPFHLDLSSKSFQVCVAKRFLCQLVMRFTLFENPKIPIIYSTVVIKTTMSMKTFLRNFSVTLFKCFMFTFVSIIFFFGIWNCTVESTKPVEQETNSRSVECWTSIKYVIDRSQVRSRELNLAMSIFILHLFFYRFLPPLF